MAPNSGTLRWYFALSDPYSWLCYRTLRDHHRGLLASLSWIPAWDPGPRIAALLAERGLPAEQVDIGKAKRFYVHADVHRLAGERGFPLTWPSDGNADWDHAHLAYLLAEEDGKAEEFLDRAFAARWERGEDISDPAVLGGLARELDLDPERLAGAAGDERLRLRGAAKLTQAAADGVFAVPLFVRDRRKFWGAERLSSLTAHLGVGE